MSVEQEIISMMLSADMDKYDTALRDAVTDCIDNEMRHGCDRFGAMLNVYQLLAAFADSVEVGVWPIPDHDWQHKRSLKV